MKQLARTLAVVATLALGGALAPQVASAGGGSGWHGGHGGGHWGHGGHWGYGYWPGAFWGGVGIGIGVGAIGYYGAYGPGYYYGYGPAWGGYYYDAPLMAAPTYGVVEPAPARSGQPVPQNAHAAEPIFYPKNGQSAEVTENDRRECNRWATAQPGAMADASIFQRATFACMEGRGYSVR